MTPPLNGALTTIASRLSRRMALGVFFVCLSAALLDGPARLRGVAAAQTADGTTGAPVFQLYGFLRLDAIYDDSRMQNHQYAFWVLPEDERSANDAHFTLHPRVTRLGMRVLPAPLAEGVEARGVVELDFQAGGSESRERLRMRLAYFEVSRGDLHALAGQTWDAIAPLYPGVHTDGILWNAGNLGDRHPQLRITWAPDQGRITPHLAVASGLTGAVDNQDLDGDGDLDGTDNGTPFVQGRLGVRHEGWFGSALAIAAWGHFAEEEIDVPAGRRHPRTWVAGIDFTLPLLRGIRIDGEAWTGADLSDLRGGIGQGVDPVTYDEVASRGGWAQLAIESADAWRLFVGASVDDPDDEDVPARADIENAGLPLSAVGRTLNWTVFVSNRYRPWQPLQIGLEYVYWVTEYRGLDRGRANRFNLHFSYFF